MNRFFFLQPILLLCFLTAMTVAATAQTGDLSGRVTDAQSDEPLVGATVRVNGTDVVSRRSGAITGRDGRYTVKSLAPGQYKVTVSMVGSTPSENDAVIVSGKTSTLDVKLKPGAVGMNEVVISASRKPEKVTDAPASVSVVSARQVQERTTLSMTDHLHGMQGVDIVQSGLVQSNVVTRGFNNIFSTVLAVLTDNRSAGVPSLRANIYNFIPLVNEDIEQIEVVRGPGSALYGPNTANGVMNIITRSPFSSAGTSIALSGGERGVFQGTFRHAGTVGDNFGYKVSGQYMQGNDWGYDDVFEDTARAQAIRATPGINPDTLKIGRRDSTIKRVAGELRLDWMPLEDMTVIGAVGRNQAINNVDLTGIGAGQVKNWSYMYYQLRVLYKDLFFQSYLNQSDAGQTYLLRSGQDIVDKSTQFVAQIQHSYHPMDDLRLTYGVDMILTNPVTDSTITGRNENDDNTTEFGAYLQAEYKLIANMLDLTAAGRIDNSNRLRDMVFSPRAALVYKPMDNHSIRLTYNRAFSTPGTNEQFLDIKAANVKGLFDVRASGVPKDGFTFGFDTAGKPLMHTYNIFGGAQLPALSLDKVASTLWPAIQSFMKTQGVNIDAIPAPPAGLVGTDLRLLNTVSQAFDAMGSNVVANRDPVKSTITSTIELGYKGVIADRFSVSLDLYTSHFKDFAGPLQVITPTVFLNMASLRTYLFNVFKASGLPDSAATSQAALLSAGIAGAPSNPFLTGVPLGTVTPNEVSDKSAVYLTYRNYGDITLYGVDFGLQASITDELSLNGTFSYTDKNFFKNLDSVADLALNSPKFKYSIGADYRDAKLGLGIGARWHHVDGFPINSGAYVSPNSPITGDPIPLSGYSTLDMNVTYQVAAVPGLTVGLTATNLLTFVEGDTSGSGPFSLRHREFEGTPAIGRLVLGRLSYAFK